MQPGEQQQGEHHERDIDRPPSRHRMVRDPPQGAPRQPVAAWFDGLTIAHGSDGTTIIHGPVADQAALYGLLQKTRDLGLPLISVNHVDPGHPQAPATETR